MNNQDFKPDFLDSKYAKIKEKIYHYTSAEGLMGIVQNKELWFTNIYFLNDNQEVFYTYNLLLDLIEELKGSIKRELYKHIEDRCNCVLSEGYLNYESGVIGRHEYYIASFSLDDDNLSLWNYYSKSDVTGYNIEFHYDKFLKKFSIYGEVCYDSEEQKQMLRNTIHKINPYINGKNNDYYLNKLFINFIIYSLFFKHQNFSSEKEYRIIIELDNFIDYKKCSFRNKKGLIIPFYKLKFDDCENNGNGINSINDIIYKIKISPINQKNITKF